MNLPDWMTVPTTLIPFAFGVLATLFVLFLSPGWRKHVQDFFGLGSHKPATPADAAAPRRVRRLAARFEVDGAVPPPRLFIRTLRPSPQKGGGWETFLDEEVSPQVTSAPAAGGVSRETHSFALESGDIVRWLLNQDETLPFKPYLLVPAHATDQYRNELCRNGHTVTGWGDNRGLPEGQWRVWFLFANGRPHGADEVQDINQAI